MLLIYEELYPILEGKEFKLEELNPYDKSKIDDLNKEFMKYFYSRNVTLENVDTTSIKSKGDYIIVPYSFKELIKNKNAFVVKEVITTAHRLGLSIDNVDINEELLLINRYINLNI
jgi:hypothetical protein